MFDEQREQEKIMETAKTYVVEEESDEIKCTNIEEEYEIERKKPNSYHLIANSKFAECYIVDKEVYLKYMLTFTTDKSLINKYLDDMVRNLKFFVCFTKLSPNNLL